MAGLMTTTQMENEVLDNLAKNGVLVLQSGTVLRDRVRSYLNRAQLHIARKGLYLQNIATTPTVTNQLQYSFPVNIRTVYGVRLEDGLQSRKLICVMPREFDKKIPKPDSQTTGRPLFYVPYEDTGLFEIFPIPDAVYTMRLRYEYFPTDLTGDNQFSDYTYLDDAIIAYATSFGFQWLQEEVDAASWKKVGDGIIKDHEHMQNTQYPDWEARNEGFTATPDFAVGEYWNNPFINGGTGLRSSNWV